MGVYIKGMQAPERCFYCIFQHEGWCDLLPYSAGGCPYNGKHPDCPIIPIPANGDLIDRGELLKKKMKMDAFAALEWVSDVDICLAKTVIPAERGEESLCDNCDERSDVGCSWCKRMEMSEE